MPYTAKNIFRMHELFKSIWDGYIDHIRAAAHGVESNRPTTRLVHSVPFRADPKVKHLRKNEIDNVISMKVNELAETKCASPVSFNPNKNGALQSGVFYCNLKAVTV